MEERVKQMMIDLVKELVEFKGRDDLNITGYCGISVGGKNNLYEVSVKTIRS